MNCKHCGKPKDDHYGPQRYCQTPISYEPEEQPDPGEGYRLLNPEVDKPQKGDEYFGDIGWVPCGIWNIRKGIFSDFPYRRKVKPEEQPEQDTVDLPVKDGYGSLLCIGGELDGERRTVKLGREVYQFPVCDKTPIKEILEDPTEIDYICRTTEYHRTRFEALDHIEDILVHKGLNTAHALIMLTNKYPKPKE